jgi:hypothetical protein
MLASLPVQDSNVVGVVVVVVVIIIVVIVVVVTCGSCCRKVGVSQQGRAKERKEGRKKGRWSKGVW